MGLNIACVSVQLCVLLTANAGFSEAAAHEDTSQRKPAASSRSSRAPATKRAVVKEYKQGETYAPGDVVSLNAEGNRLAVEVVRSKAGGQSNALRVKLSVSGKLQVFSFTYGGEQSAISLVAGEKRIAASAADFTDEVVASASEPALFTRMRTNADRGTLVIDTSEHPLILEFAIPDDLSKAPKQLELREVGIGGRRYSLTVRL